VICCWLGLLHCVIGLINCNTKGLDNQDKM
jgi:hypothetical protein